MAKVLGESGRYASQEEIKKFRQHYLVIISVIAILGGVLGYLLCLNIQVRKFSSVTTSAAVLILFVTQRQANRQARSESAGNKDDERKREN